MTVFKIIFEKIRNGNDLVEVIVSAENETNAIAMSQESVGTEYKFSSVYDEVDIGVIEINSFSKEA